MLTSRVLAMLAALLVGWRVVPPTSQSLATGSGTALTATATGVLLATGLALVGSAVAHGLTGRALRWFAASLAAYLVVMAGYLLLGLLLGAHVPWTAYAVLVGVALLGGGALRTGRPAR